MSSDLTNHILDYSSGLDQGNASFPSSNFTWGTTTVDAGNTLDFITGGLYTRTLTLGGGNIAAAKAQVQNFSGDGILYYSAANPANAYLYNDYLLHGPIYFGSGVGEVMPVLGPDPAPEPTSLCLLGLGAIGLLARRRRTA